MGLSAENHYLAEVTNAIARAMQGNAGRVRVCAARRGSCAFRIFTRVRIYVMHPQVVMKTNRARLELNSLVSVDGFVRR